MTTHPGITLFHGQKAAADIQSHISAKTDPVAWNTSVALSAILNALDAQQKQLDRIERSLQSR
jgi:hypothetical protein